MNADKVDPFRRDLYAAIGRVASTSARLETTFRYLLNDLAKLGDVAWILFEGQSLDSLISSCRTILWFDGAGATGLWVDGAGATGWGLDHRVRLTKLLDECTELRRRRNVVIHGTWSDHCDYEDFPEADRECEPRPRDASKDDRTYFFKRSRQRVPLGDIHLAINDIEALADQFEEMDSRTKALQREANEAERRRWKLKEGEGK